MSRPEDRIADALERIAAALERLADKLAPKKPDGSFYDDPSFRLND